MTNSTQSIKIEEPAKLILVKGRRVINPKYLEYDFSKYDDLTLLSVPKTSSEKFDYEYKGKTFKSTWTKWFSTSRKPHITDELEEEESKKSNGIRNYIMVDIVNDEGIKTKVKRINPEYIKWELSNNDCEMITSPNTVDEYFKYRYQGKVYSTTYKYWREGGRPHLDILSPGYEVYKNILDSPVAFTSKAEPDWYKRKVYGHL